MTDPIAQALALVPPGAGADEAREYLDHGEAGLAVDILAEFYDRDWRPPPSWWDLLIEAADQMGMHDTARWCRWARRESVVGTIRATVLTTPGVALSPRGETPSMWLVAGHRLAARTWVESAPALPPSGSGTIRLIPELPARWPGLHPGDELALVTGGIATVIAVTPAVGEHY